MIKSFTIVNDHGDSIELDIRRPEISGFLVSSVIGLAYPNAEISVMDYAAFDGSIFAETRIPQRNIVMTIIFYQENNQRLSVMDLRHKCYRFFPIKKYIRLYIENDSGVYWIDGYIEANDINIFSQQEGAVISILCDDPYFTKVGLDIISPVSKVTPNFSFPCSFEFIRDDSYYWIRYKLITDENDSDGLTGTIIGFDSDNEQVEIHAEDIEKLENEAAGYTFAIDPDSIYHDL